MSHAKALTLFFIDNSPNYLGGDDEVCTIAIPFLISGRLTLKGDLRRGGNWSALSSEYLSSLSKPMLTY